MIILRDGDDLRSVLAVVRWTDVLLTRVQTPSRTVRAHGWTALHGQYENNKQSLSLASFHRVSSDTMQIINGLRRQDMVKLIVGRARYPGPADQSPSPTTHNKKPPICT
ncbi:hypothetical protein LZ30DRAFT_708727 [Colletotrichum cereale]|nr:hypothetical protein LZ30DRAFT_708727 [Colletotrichum cereale]